MTKGTGVIFGAGSVGRGFIGQIFSMSGLEVVFADVDTEIITALNRDGTYPHFTLSDSSRERREIGPVRAIYSTDSEAVNAAVLNADIIATSVGAAVLPRIAPGLAAGLALRMEQGCPPVNILLCENLYDCAVHMRSYLKQHLPAEYAARLDAEVGLLETSIGRMIPVITPELRAIHPAAISVEPYMFLPYDAAAEVGSMPTITGLIADTSVPFSFYVNRKLYLFNMGHATCAWLGEILGLKFVWQAIARPDIYHFVRAAMLEIALALAKHYSTPVAPLIDHVDDLLYRFGNHATADTVERVGRDPERKLAASDRMFGAYRLAVETGMPRRYLAIALAAGLARLSRERDAVGSSAACAEGVTYDEKATSSEVAVPASVCAVLRERMQHPDVGEPEYERILALTALLIKSYDANRVSGGSVVDSFPFHELIELISADFACSNII